MQIVEFWQQQSELKRAGQGGGRTRRQNTPNGKDGGGKLLVLDQAARARWLLGQLDTAELLDIYAVAIRMAAAHAHVRGMPHQLALPMFERKWLWEPLIIGAEPRIIGEE